MFNKVVLGPEARKMATFAITGLGKIGAIAATSVFTSRLLKEAVGQYSEVMQIHASNVKDAFRH